MGTDIYFYGITKRMWGAVDSNRFTFIHFFNTVDETYGSHLATSKQTNTVVSSPYSAGVTSTGACPYCETAGNFQTGVSINDMSGTRTSTPILVSDFDI